MKPIILFFLAIFISLASYAQKSYTKDEVNAKMETQQKEMQYLKENIEYKTDAQDKRLIEQDKNIQRHCERIQDIQSHQSSFNTKISIIIGVFGIIVALAVGFGGFVINLRAKERTKDSLKKIDDELKEIQLLKGQVEKESQLVTSLKTEVEACLEKINSYTKRAEEGVDGIEKKEKELLDKIKNTSSRDQSEEEKKEILKEVESNIEDINKTKPLAEYTSDDWFLKGYEASENGNYEDACYYYRKTTEKDINFAYAYNNWGVALQCLAKKEDNRDLYIESIRKYKRAIEINPNYSNAYNNWGSAMLGYSKLNNSMEANKQEIVQLLEKAELLKKGNGSYNLACLYSLLNDIEPAFRWFEIALKVKTERSREFIENDSDFDNIRKDPRYKELLDKYRPLPPQNDKEEGV